MSATSSPTLLQDTTKFIDQTTSGGLLRGTAINKAENLAHQSLSYTAFALVDRTHDGGTRLERTLPRRSPHTYKLISSFLNPLFSYLLSGLITKGIELTLVQRVPRSNTLSLSLHGTLPHIEAIQWIREMTGLSQDRIARLLDVSRQTLYNWEKGVPIADHNRQRLFGVRDVLERAATRYPTQALLVSWLDTPRGADGRTPAQILEANEIDRARLLAIATPSFKLIPAQPWVKRPIPQAFQTRGEDYHEALPPEQGGEYLEDEDSVDSEEFIFLDDEIYYDVEDLPNP
jgi:transcriptional regulator with XRE-family HTH domain